MRLGVVELKVSYVVDLDNKDMVENAIDTVADDIYSMVKHDEVANWIKREERNGLKESEIEDIVKGE